MPHTLLANNSYLKTLPKLFIAANYFCHETDTVNCPTSTSLALSKKPHNQNTKQKTLSFEFLGLLQHTRCSSLFLP